MRTGADECGRSTVYSVHIRLNRQAERAFYTPPPAICLAATITHKYVFDYQDGDIYWCTADVGWVTGHSLYRLRSTGERRRRR